MTTMIILAAGMGTRLGEVSKNKPKCLVQLHGKPLLDIQITAAYSAGIENIVVVKGYRAEDIKYKNVHSCVNEDYANTNMVETLFCAKDFFGRDVIVSYGDIVYEKQVLTNLLKSQYDNSVVVDTQWLSYWKKRFERPEDDAESLKIDDKDNICEIGQELNDLSSNDGQYIGLMRFHGNGVEDLRSFYQKAKAGEFKNSIFQKCPRPFQKLYMTDLLQGMIDYGHKLNPSYTKRRWLEIDSIKDLELAHSLSKINGDEIIITS